MPSEALAREALTALAAPQSLFRSTLDATAESVRLLLEETRAAAAGHADRLSAEFGALGPRYLDLDKLAAVIESGPSVDPAAVAVVERAYAALQDLSTRDAHVVAVPPGGSLAQTVGDALADVGRAMGAARVVDLARTDRYRQAEHERYLAGFPFGLWSQAERRLAPPLVVSVAGADLRPAALADYLDGGVKIVLLVQAPATPAPLVRLITPGVFVAQAADMAVVSRLAAVDGAGIVAIMPEGSAEFVHDPAGGASLGGRLTVTAPPAGTKLHRLGPFTVAQQRDEIGQLADFAAAGAATATAEFSAAGSSEDDTVGKLAAWLLTQAEGGQAPDKEGRRS